ncbi:protein-export membrane protein SecD [Abditibacterium utsteinense]|uniref:Protein translocase subunit SecD n=1 Tax=Abditibacterium utsteinense TaxID=1960156 RepID=A0A2S8SVY5_9BACT|nr:protein translocase subunit SecD [Abditibacterium utsteinense]PQV64949.1 protein-export membrane protein SecD [Abditibacterium utsteinense]
MKSRPIQYLGLAALLLLSLAVIFLPIGARPEAQSFTIPLVAPLPFQQLIASTQKAPDVADAAFVAAFKDQTLPGALSVGADGKSASVEDKAATRAEATQRANQIVAALSGKFKGVKLAPNFAQSIEKLPAQPLFPISRQLAVFPPKIENGSAVPAVKLGLDLQGGVNLVLQVRRALFAYTVSGIPSAQTAREEFLGKVRTAFSQTDQSAGLRGADVSFHAGAANQLEVRTQASDRAQFDAQIKAIDAALKTVSGATFASAKAPQFYLPQESVGQQLGYKGDYSSQLLDKTVEIIRSRVDKLGVSEPLIQKQLPDRVIVQLPGVNDPQKAVAVIGTTAQMEIRLLPANLQPVSDPKDSNNTLFSDAQGNLIDSKTVREQSQLIVSGVDVKPTTTAGFAEGGQAGVFFELQGEGSRKFADVTTQVAGKGRFIPIFLDDKCISAPTVQSPITGGRGQITMGQSGIEAARSLAVLLNSGALPAPIDVVENRTVSATLGQDSLVKSLRAGAIGLLCVAVFMVLYYRLAGVLANCALLVYCVLNLAVFILVGGTLTLPGIAGFLLALAMSLDTNILVFERLKEEMVIQPTFAAALRAAFSRAWTAILDSHVTTLIAATVLFYFGTGPVKGFALTLAIGVLLSLFSAISVTRLFMWSAAGAGERNRGFFAGKLPPADKVLAQRN